MSITAIESPSLRGHAERAQAIVDALAVAMAQLENVCTEVPVPPFDPTWFRMTRDHARAIVQLAAQPASPEQVQQLALRWQWVGICSRVGEQEARNYLDDARWHINLSSLN